MRFVSGSTNNMIVCGTQGGKFAGSKYGSKLTKLYGGS